MAGFRSVEATLKERADLACVMLSVVSGTEDLSGSVGRVIGYGLPMGPGCIEFGPSSMALWLAPRSWLLICALDEEHEFERRIHQAFPDKIVHSAVFSDALCWLELSGRGSLRVLESGLNCLECGGFRLRHAKRTILAGVTTIVVHERENSWLLGVERSRAPYMAEWLIETARRLESMT